MLYDLTLLNHSESYFPYLLNGHYWPRKWIINNANDWWHFQNIKNVFFLPVLFHQVDNRDYFTNPFNNSVLLKKHLKMHLNFWNKEHERNISSIRKQCILKIQHFFSVKISIEVIKWKLTVSISHLEKTSQEGMYSHLATRQPLFSILVLLDTNFYILQKIALPFKP